MRHEKRRVTGESQDWLEIVSAHVGSPRFGVVEIVVHKGKQIVAIAPSSAVRYLATWLFADITPDSDTLDLDALTATGAEAV